MSTIVTESDIKWENVLQQIFMECDVCISTSTPDSTEVGDEVPISRLVEYVQEQLPSWSIDNMVELWKCLVAVSTNDRVNLQQFKEAAKCWIAKVLQAQPSQDSNNNAPEKLYIVSDTDSSMKTVDMDKDIIEFELRMKLRELHEENILLRDELERHEASIDNHRQQHAIAEKQLDRYVQKCQHLEKENDEQRDQLNEAIKNKKTIALTFQRSMKEHQNLLKQLEAIEIEVQVIPTLKDKIEKISKEKMDCKRQVAKLQEEFDEKENECKQLKIAITELEDTNIKMRETYEYTIRNLREKNRQLADENTELQSLSIVNGCLSGERLSMSPIPDTDGCCVHSTPFKSVKVALQDSLYAELKASGFTAECSRNISNQQEFEEEMNDSDVAISTILEQLEKVTQIFATMRSSDKDISQFNSQDKDARTYNIEALKHKVAALLNVVEEITRRNVKDSSTQLRADPNVIEGLSQFGVTSFQDLLSTRAQPYAKAETDLRSITSQCMNDNKDDYDDSFSRVIRTYAGAQNRFGLPTIDPIVEELHDIIESTLDTLVDHKDCSSSSGSSRYRSVHTLPPTSQSLQPSSLNTEDSRQYISSCQNTKMISPDAAFARGDSLTQENSGEKLVFDTRTSKQESSNLERNQSNEMPKVSNILKLNSKVLTTSEEETSVNKSFQIPEMSSASNPASPRRKISVYCRSFDVQDLNEDQPLEGSSLKVRESSENLSDTTQYATQIDETINETAAEDLNSKFTYSFNHDYRNTMNNSDSSNDSTPKKQFQGCLLDDELSVEHPVQPILSKVHLAPTRFKFPQKVNNELNRTAEDPNCASSVVDFTETDISSSLLSPVTDRHKEDDNVSVHSSSTFIIEKCKTGVGNMANRPKSCSANKNFDRGHPMLARRLIPYNQLAKIADSEDPHSQNVPRVSSKNEPRVKRSVDSQMSNREDSSAGSDSECEPAVESSDRCIGEKVVNDANKASAVSSTPLNGSAIAKVIPRKNVVENDGKAHNRDQLNAKQGRRKQLLLVRRSFSDSEKSGRSKCCCKQNDRFPSAPLIPEGDQPRIFPSLKDVYLQISGIANISDTELDSWENLSELELQKRYTAFSLCLCTDRVTLPRRIAMSLRQRDQSEKNFICEVQKMQQDIQELAPLCTDRESVERVERVRHQLDMIARCAHRVSCTAETLGAVHQERRVSRAVHLADKYLQVLHSRCEKLAANVAETKRILTENNIVIEENSGELGDDLPRIRYRSGTPANNRMMMARRRASIATITRPVGNTQDVTKDTVRQRNSVSGRMTLRRPSFSSESPKWETEKLDCTDSNSISELRGIFEQAESRHNLREENNNMLRLNHSNSQSLIVNNKIWLDEKQEASPEFLSVNEDINLEHRSCARPSQYFQLRNAPWRTILWGIVIFFLGFFVNQALSMVNTCNGPLNRWSIEQILGRYVQIRNTVPHPM